MEDLSYKELETLVEAMENWEQGEDGTGDMLLGAIGSTMTKDNPEAQQKLDKQLEERKAKRRDEKRRRKRVSTVIKAKLYDLMDTRSVDNQVKN